MTICLFIAPPCATRQANAPQYSVQSFQRDHVVETRIVQRQRAGADVELAFERKA